LHAVLAGEAILIEGRFVERFPALSFPQFATLPTAVAALMLPRVSR
jgi:hypothetical protein